MQTNSEIRTAMRGKKIPAWMIADAEGVHENTILRRLRHELPAEEKQRILSIIDRIAADKAAEVTA